MKVVISSVQNPRVKRLVLLQQKAKARKEAGLFVVEGKREVARALKAGWELREFWHLDDELPFSIDLKDIDIFQCTLPVFKRIAYREADAGVVAVFNTKHFELSELSGLKKPLIVVLERVEKPGNLGAIIRTCNGLGVDGIVVCDATTEIFNPNVIRNSLGGFFDLPIIQCSSQQAIAFFKDAEISIYTTYLSASLPYTEVDFTGGSAIVLGSEADGISNLWVENTSQNIIIPMTGIVDSLNVSVAAGIVIAEAMRQRSIT